MSINSKHKRVQIPISEGDEQLLKTAAQRAGVPLAEWARVHLLSEAKKSVGAGSRTPRQALEALFALNAPIADIDEMLAQTVRGRLT